jgi:Lactonase, 7-bladed beta-propeller
VNTLNPSLRTVIGVAIAALLAQPLAGCSGASSSLPAPVSTNANHLYVPPAANAKGSAAQRVGPDADGQFLFVSDNENNRIAVFNAASKTQNPPAERTITQGIHGPNGIATDLSGNLYVANYVSNTVTVYGKNSSSPKTTISSGLNGPWDVKVDGFGNVYVSNTPLDGATNYISEYLAGSSSPSTTWNAPQANMEISGFTLLNATQQGQTQIFALGYVQNPSGFATGGLLGCFSGSANCVVMQGFPSFGQTGGIAMVRSPHPSGPYEFLAVDQYIPGVDDIIPSQTPTQLVTGGTPEFITLNSKSTRLFVADRFYGRVTEYSYPKDKKLNTFTPGGGQIYGVATFPSGNFH